MTCFKTGQKTAAAILVILLNGAGISHAEQITRTERGDTVIWDIYKPNVKQEITRYPKIRIYRDDIVTIKAGGCVQTGGLGKTWKRYVNPSGPDSKKYYFGLIQLCVPNPKADSDCGCAPEMVPIGQALEMRHPVFICKTSRREFTSLVLGYSDDDYRDNGYWGHDDGTGNQCKDVGPAWFKIIIKRGS